MGDTRNANNNVILEGYVNSKPELHHSTYGEGIYEFTIEIERLNHEVSDFLKVDVSERLIDISELEVGVGVYIEGQFRSYNKRREDGQRVSLMLSVFAREIEVIDADEVRNINTINLEGYTCKPTTYRTTPMGREICDILVAVNRPYGKSDYLPCITWGRNARFSSNLEVGTGISLEGRVQSRNYTKRTGDGEDDYEERTAYEVSVSKISVFQENDTEDDEDYESEEGSEYSEYDSETESESEE
jgi:single-stranded DNA-binding protein